MQPILLLSSEEYGEVCEVLGEDIDIGMELRHLLPPLLHYKCGEEGVLGRYEPLPVRLLKHLRAYWCRIRQL